MQPPLPPNDKPSIRLLNLAPLFAGWLFCATSIFAQAIEATAPWQDIGGKDFAGWKGIQLGADGTALWKAPTPVIYRYPTGPRGWYYEGFRQRNDSSADWSEFYGLQFDVLLPEGRAFKLEATATIPPQADTQEHPPGSRAQVTISGKGWQRVTLPWSAFDFDKGRTGFMEFISELRLAGAFVDGAAGEIQLKTARLVRAPAIALEAAVQGQAVPAGGVATYEVVVGNATAVRQIVALTMETKGWEAMAASVEPASVTLEPSATQAVKVTVRVPENGVPPGGHERQKLVAVMGSAPDSQTLEFVTAREVGAPSLQLTPAGWAEVREKVQKYDWARREQEQFVKAADAWRVPEVSTPEERSRGPEGHPYVFLNPAFEQLPKAAVAWQLTRNPEYAEKAALFLRRLADEKTGFASVLAGTSMGEPQEGGNFQAVAIAYDAIRDANVLSEPDRASIERMLRLYIETVEPSLRVGNVGNWSVAGSTSALFCALALGDLHLANRYLYGPCGFVDFVSKGIMDDGWWWECSTGYNFWVAAELTQCALAVRPWGIDLLHQEFPANFSPRTIITPWGLNPPYGMSFEKWGPNRRNTRSIKQLWDVVPATADYRGVAFGMNDGHDELVSGSRLDLAYYAFRDPAYLPLLKQSKKRDLIYGVPELPDTVQTPGLASGLAENLGYALLRSQTENRPPREQIQAVFKIGSQGGYHGHFDRASLNTIMRYGRSFWNPEAIWWGYPNFMYKFYVQSSLAHNMVVVDQKQQEAVPSSQLLFHSGKMMQVSAQESDARWCDPPYGGMKYSARSSEGAVTDFAAGMKRNRQSVPLMTDRQQGDLGPFSDRVRQRRLGIVTDDYIVIADDLKSEQTHTFDNIFQMKGLQSLEAPGKKLLRHDAQFTSNPYSAGQFITDADWYQASAPVVGKFLVVDGAKDTSRSINESGILKLDAHLLWPQQQEFVVAQPPEALGGQQWVTYEIRSNGTSLAKGKSGMWILGAVDLDVPVQSGEELTIEINNDGDKKALFLANARFVTTDGKELPLEKLPVAENTASPPKPGQDYDGGPIKITGVPFTTAISAQPIDKKKPAILHLPAPGPGVVRFKATLGGDYPSGNEAPRRKIFASRVQGTEARFLTVLEPYEDKSMVKSATATGPDLLRIELTDGRVQDITIQNLSGSGKDITVQISETKAGQTLRSEKIH